MTAITPTTRGSSDAPSSFKSYHLPEPCSGDRWITLGIFVGCCLYFSLFYDYTLLNADEGIVLQGAQRILEGQVLYRDFFAFYTPGSYYWVALLFKVFGSSILVCGGALVAYGGLFSVLTYLLSRRICSRLTALFAVYLVTMSGLSFRFVLLHNWDSTLLATLTIYCGVLLLERGHWIWAFAAGSFASLTALFEQSKGVGLVVGLFAGLAVIALRNQSRGLFSARGLSVLMAGLSWPFVLTFGYFASKHCLREMISDWFWPLYHYSIANKLPYGYLVMATTDRTLWLQGSWGARILMTVILGPCFLLPVVPILAAGVFVWFSLKSRPDAASMEKWRYLVLVSSGLTGLILSAFLTKRPDFTHLNFLAPLLYVAAAWVFDGLELKSRLWTTLKPIAVFLVLLSFTSFGMAMLLPTLNAHHKFPTVRGTIRTEDPDYALEYLQTHTRAGQTILVHPYEPLYYYLTATSSPTRFDYLQPGMHTPEQFQETVRALEKNQVSLVFIELSFSEKFALGWPNTPLEVIAARDPVIDYLFEHYRPCASLTAIGNWHFVAMVPKGVSCPSGDKGGSQKN
jgi:hypothetical protein